MLASARRSAWRPAPLVGSVAAKVSTAGSEGTGSFMGAPGLVGGLHLKPGLRCARQPGVATMLQGARVSSHSTQQILRVRLCLPPCLPRNRGLSRCGAAWHAASYTTRRRDGPRTASRRVPVGKTFRPAGAARNAGEGKKISRWGDFRWTATAPFSDNVLKED